MLKIIFSLLVALIALYSPLATLYSYASETGLTGTGQALSRPAGDVTNVKAGMPLPSPRFKLTNGAVTDSQTGLVWLQNANCTDTVGGVTKVGGYLTWADARKWSDNLSSGRCGLSDGSAVGQWRLPTRLELESLVDASKINPALPAGHPFINVQSNYYWSSSTYESDSSSAWIVGIGNGVIYYVGGKKGFNFVWPVRGGR
jgi:hypothetical protein